jgi:tetratricopeptide (TPR) repeat protein
VNNIHRGGSIMEENITLGQKLKKARIAKNLTQQDVAGDFITRNMLSKIENDLAKPSIKTIEYLTKRLSKPISYFLENMVEGIVDTSEVADDTNDNLELVFEYTSRLIKELELDKCINYLEEVIRANEHNIMNPNLARILYNLALCYYKKELYSMAKDSFEKASFILLKNKDYYYLSNSYFRLDNIFYSQNNYLKSEEYGKKAIEYLQKSFIDDVLYEIKLYFSLSFSSKELRKYSEAIDYLLKALDISKQHNCHYNSGEIHMLLANIYKKTKKLVEAIYHAEKAIVFFDFTESYEMKATTQMNLGNFWIIIGDYDKSIEFYEKSLQYFIESKNDKKANTVKCGLLECLTRKGLFRDAINYSEDIVLEVLAKEDIGNLNKLVGKAFFELKNLDNAKKYLFRAEEYLLTTNHYDYLSDTYNILAQLYSETQEYQEAYKYSIKANEHLEKSISTGIIYVET